MRINKNTKLSTASCALAVTLAVLQGCGGGGGSPASTPTGTVAGTPGAGTPPAPVSGTPPAPVAGPPAAGTPPAPVGGLPGVFSTAFAEKDGSTFYAFNGENTLATSVDAINWTTKAVTGMAGVRVVRKLNGAWLSVGANGGIYTSPDGISWTARTSNVSAFINNVTFGGGQYVAVGRPDGTGKNFAYSSNATSWTSGTIGSGVIVLGVTYANNQFIAVGYEPNNNNNGAIFTSPNGTAWTRQTVPIIAGLGNVAAMQSISAKGSSLVAVGNFGVVYTSTDNGVTWVWATPSGVPISRNFLVVDCNTATCVATSSAEGGNTAAVMSSTDLINWNVWTTPSLQDLRGVSFNGALWSVTGQSGFSAWSPTGVTWTPNPVN
jgi:hypothetical protein